jgi:hypothetical protein
MFHCHELLGFMSPALARDILEYSFAHDKLLYRASLAAVADAKKVRPVFLEKKPRTERHVEMLAMLSRPRLEEAAANLLRAWLLKAENAMVVEFLDGLGIAHEKGVVEDFPATVEDARLTAAVDALLAKHPAEKVGVYLHMVKATGAPGWKNLDALLESDKRLQLG